MMVTEEEVGRGGFFGLHWWRSRQLKCYSRRASTSRRGRTVKMYIFRCSVFTQDCR